LALLSANLFAITYKVDGNLMVKGTREGGTISNLRSTLSLQINSIDLFKFVVDSQVSMKCS
jgi:hypothetical protein